MADTMIQETEFVKMRNFILKNIRKLKELWRDIHSLRITFGGRVGLMAATNKCLAQRNKTRAGPKATNKRPAARRNFLGAANWRDLVAGISAAGLHRLLAARILALVLCGFAAHELGPH
jgi:hypothetical protein